MCPIGSDRLPAATDQWHLSIGLSLLAAGSELRERIRFLWWEYASGRGKEGAGMATLTPEAIEALLQGRHDKPVSILDPHVRTQEE